MIIIIITKAMQIIFMNIIIITMLIVIVIFSNYLPAATWLGTPEFRYHHVFGVFAIIANTSASALNDSNRSAPI